MKQVLLVLFVMACQACHNSEVQEEKILPSTITLRDSLIKVTNDYKKLFKRSVIKDSIISAYDAYIDTIQKEILSSQTDVIRLHYIQIQIKIFAHQNKELIEKLDHAQMVNSTLSQININISDSVKNMRVKLYKSQSENNEYKKSIKFKIANVRLSAWGYIKKGWFKKPELDTVSTAKLTKFIEVSFIVPANDRLQKTTYVVNVRIRGVNGRGINKDLLIHFNGMEQDGLYVRFDDPDAFQVGYHHAEITLDNENLYTGSIYLK